MSLIDTAVVGRYCGSRALAALSPGCTLIDSSSYLFFFIATAATNLVAAARAEGDHAEAERVLSEASFLALVGGCLLTAASLLFGLPLLRGIAGAASAEVVPEAFQYAVIRAWGQPAVLMASVSRAAALAAQDTKGPLLSVLLSFFLNALGTLVLVRGWGFGVQGAAAATLAADVAAAAFLLHRRWRLTAQQHSKKSQAAKLTMEAAQQVLTTLPLPPLVAVPSRRRARAFLLFAVPIFLTLLGKSVVYNGVSLSIGRCGAVALAAHQVLLRAFFFFTPIGDSVGMTSQVFLPAILKAERRAERQQVAGQATLDEATVGTATWGARRTLFCIGLLAGALGATFAASVPARFGHVFTTEQAVLGALRDAAPLLAAAVALHAVALSCEGMLLAERDLGFLSASYVLTTAGAAAVLLSPATRPASLNAAWALLACFQGARAVQFSLRCAWLAAGRRKPQEKTSKGTRGSRKS